MIRNYAAPQSTPFVGRTAELQDIAARFADDNCRLLTLTGLGGSGKTRLAIEVARAITTHYQHGVTFVPLQPIPKSELLTATIAQAIGLSFYGDETPETQLFNFLHEKSMLLLLDNFEHLADGAPLVSAILAHTSAVKILVTSREALDVREEWLYPVKGMPVPSSVYATSLEDYEAVRLFLYHARRIQPSFDLAAEHEPVIRICQLTAGLPLAIELAVSWLKGLTATQIAREMQHNLDFVAAKTRDREERHRSIRTVFNQSWEFLAESERQVFSRLSVFHGGFDQEAALAVTDATLQILSSLVEKSLLQRKPSGRFEIHELLRQFGEEKLGEATSQARECHGRYFAEFVHERELDLKGRRQIEGLDIFEHDFENVRAAWSWAVQSREQSILRIMAEGLLWYGVFRSVQRNVNSLYEQALTQLTDDDAAFLRACIALKQSHLLPHEAEPSLIAKRMEANLRIVQASDDEREAAIGETLLAQFLAGVEERQFEHALEIAQHALHYFQSTNDRFYMALAIYDIADSYYFQGDRQQAIPLLTECAKLRREIGDFYGTARTLLLIAAEAYSIPDYEKSERYNREVRDMWRALKSWAYVAFVDVNLAYLAVFRGDLEAAKELSTESLTIARDVNIGDHIAYALAMCGAIASIEERYSDAWKLLMEAQALAMHSSSIEALEWGLPLAACGLHDYDTARGANLRAFHHARRLNAPGRYFWHLPAACVMIAHDGQSERAVELLGLLFTHPASAPAWMEAWGVLTRLRVDLEGKLGAARYQSIWKRGETLALEDTVKGVMEWLAGNPHQTPPAKSMGLLTSREADVLRCLAAGLTNPQIAERLVIGAGTVKTHTLNIYRKLDVANRTQAIVRAQELGILHD